jgi:diguanylate cyclase (GGDEF)-like protein/PAS domain S-box-containing protein
MPSADRPESSLWRPPANETAGDWPAFAAHVRDVLFTADATGQLLLVSRAAETRFGWAADDVLGRRLADLVPVDVRPTIDQMLALTAGHPDDDGRLWRLAVLAADGRRVAVDVSIARALDASGEVLVHGVMRDVTGRQEAEEALRHSEERFRLLVETSADGLMLLSPDARIFFASHGVVRSLGHPSEQLIGRDLLECVHPEDRDRAAWVLADAIAQPAAALHTEYRCSAQDGSWRVHEAVVVNHLGQPSLNAIVLNFRDVTERRAAERALHESEQRFRAVFESALVGIARIGLDGRILEVNRAIADLCGVPPASLIGRPVSTFVHEPDGAAARDEFQLVVSGERPSSRTEQRCVAAGGRVFWASLTATLVRDAAGVSQFVLLILENINDRKNAEAELRETNQRLSVWIQELEERTREIGLLGDMGDLLQACRSPQEACSVVVPIAAKLFPHSAGVLSLVAEGSPTLVEPIARWGGLPALDSFEVGDCWALRRGRGHIVPTQDDGPRCRHLERLEGRAWMCVPLMAHGALLGVLSVIASDESTLNGPRQRLVSTVAEHVALALANLKLEASLRSQSIRDPLTNLFNRRYMEESLEREMRRAIRNRGSVGIIMLDIDHFKTVNDVHGHDAGDAMLRAIGELVQRSIRAEDIACRYGGEEFTLILPDAALQEAAQRADALRESVKHIAIAHRRQALPAVTVSAGVATYPEHGPTADVVLRAADAALYQAKVRGRDRVVLNQTGGLFPEALVEFGRRA